jgi:hypothetical protein
MVKTHHLLLLNIMSRGITLTEQQAVRFAQLLIQREKDKQRSAADMDYRR